MVNITLSIPNELHKLVKKHSEIKWSEIARRAMWIEARKLDLMDNLTAKSKLTEKDIEELDHKIKAGLLERYSWMKIIVDTNRILAALLSKGDTRRIILSSDIEFYTLDYVTEEINKYMDYILEKTGMNKKDVDLLFSLFMQNITIIPEEDIKPNMKKALEIMKSIDPKDTPVVACALSVKNSIIWSEDKHFDRQSKIKIYKTKDLLKYI